MVRQDTPSRTTHWEQEVGPQGKGAGRPASEEPWENVPAGARGWHRGIAYWNWVPSGNSACADFRLLITLPSTALSSAFPGASVPCAFPAREYPGAKSVPTPWAGHFLRTRWPHAWGHTHAHVHTGSARVYVYTRVLVYMGARDTYKYTQRGTQMQTRAHTQTCAQDTYTQTQGQHTVGTHVHTGINMHRCARGHTQTAAAACTCADTHAHTHKCVFMHTNARRAHV